MMRIRTSRTQPAGAWLAWTLIGGAVCAGTGLVARAEAPVAATIQTEEVGPLPAAQRLSAQRLSRLAGPADASMWMPTDVAVDTAGRVYVADGANHRVAVFGADGSWQPPIEAAGEHKLDRPIGVTTNDAGQLWIADGGLAALLVLNEQRELVQHKTLSEVVGDRAVDPTDIAISPDGARVCVVDNDHHRLLMQTVASQTWVTVGSYGDSAAGLRWPFMAVFAGDGDLYVTDVIGARVQRLSAANQWAGQLGRWGVQPGMFYRPKGIAIDSRDQLYVSDSTLNVVQVFTLRGRFVGVLAEADGRPMRFAHPMGMCFDGAGRLYVVELATHQVAVLNVGAAGSSPTTRPAGQGGQP